MSNPLELKWLKLQEGTHNIRMIMPDKPYEFKKHYCIVDEQRDFVTPKTDGSNMVIKLTDGLEMGFPPGKGCQCKWCVQARESRVHKCPDQVGKVGDAAADMEKVEKLREYLDSMRKRAMMEGVIVRTARQSRQETTMQKVPSNRAERNSNMRGQYAQLIEMGVKHNDEFGDTTNVESDVVRSALVKHQQNQREAVEKQVIEVIAAVEQQKKGHVDGIRAARRIEAAHKKNLTLLDKALALGKKNGNFVPALYLLGVPVPGESIPEEFKRKN